MIVRRLSWVLLAVTSCVAPAMSQNAELEGRTVVAVEYSPAKQPLAPEDLARIQTVKKGAPLHLAEVSGDIDQLFATGRYEDIRVEAEPVPGGVVVRFVTTQAWFVGQVSIDSKNFNPPNRGQLAAATRLNLGMPFQQEDVDRAQRSIKRLLEQNGLYEAQLESQMEKDEEGQQVLFTFRIVPGKRAKYTDPLIEGDTKLPAKTIVRATGWQIRFIGWWRQVTQSRTRNGLTGIRKKYQKQDRLSAKVELKSLKYDPATRRAQPNLNINAGPKIAVKAIETKVSKRVLQRYVPIYVEGQVDRDLLVEGARNLRDYFQSQGYYDVDVTFREPPPENDLQTIEYVISRGQRYKVVRVDITGSTYFATEDVRERMFIEPAGLLRLRHGRYSEAFRRKDEENIANLYKANGFRDVKVQSTVVRDYQGKDGDIAVTIDIQQGPQSFVDSLTVNGVKQLNRDEVTSALAASPGQPYSDVAVATDRNRILTTYFEKGFPDAAFRFESSPSDTPNHFNLTYTITEGNQQFVRDVLVRGLRTTRQSLVDKHITLEAGDPLSLPAMTQIQKTFYDLGIFARVDTAVQNPEGVAERKYVLYNFEEAQRYTVNIGIGAEVAQFGGTTTDISSPGSTTGFSPRLSLDVSRLNFLGLGHVVTVRGVVSNLQQRGSFSYLEPRFQNVEGRNVTFTLLYDNSRDVRTFASRREEASIQLSQQFTKAVTGLFRFAYRRVSVGDVVIPTLLVPQLLQPVRLGILSANLAQDRRDNPTDARRGIYNTMDVGLASRAFGSQRNFGRVLVRNATYHPLKRNLVFARETQFGAVLPFSVAAGTDAAESIPLPERFFGGGASSHRGFGYNQAGPRDIGASETVGAPTSLPTGFPLGGNALFFNTVEFRFPLIGDNIGGVLFHDMGNVYRSLGDISFRASQRNLQDFNYMVHAAGFGVRYRTPIGPVRVDLAYSINPPSFVGFKGTAQELLSCGPNSAPTGVCQRVQQSLSHFQFFFNIGQTF